MKAIVFDNELKLDINYKKPEPKEGEALIKPDAKTYVIDDAELERVYREYPVIWKDKDAQPKLCFMGCPHMSLQQLKDWTDKVE